MSKPYVQIGADIGGTFTDVALEIDDKRYSVKVLTTKDAPEKGVMQGVSEVLSAAGLTPGDVDLIIHGTTLATNAIIERKGAKTALITTDGFRDALEIGTEGRFDQYDIYIDKPAPLVPRRHRYAVKGRLDATGKVLVDLDEDGLSDIIDQIEAEGIQSIAVGFIHAYMNPEHERRARDILAARLPNVRVTLSSEVSPEMREFERFSTAVANAYVQPLMAEYLEALRGALKSEGFDCPLFLMLSGGGLTTIETAMRFPIRLVESGPAGGAIFAAHIAKQCGLDEVLSYDMGGTTAKICLIDGGEAQTARHFEVARMYRFKKGSGIPLRIPVIEMVEIGAGGGSLAAIDSLGRITVGPESAGSDPGPICYDLGGKNPAVTDADLTLGKIDPDGFSGGRMRLNAEGAASALVDVVGKSMDSDDPRIAAFGVSEVVDENMASAARVHAIESGKNAASRTLIAFGGAAPLHAARLAEKLEIQRVIVPTAAGVGSAVGFLRAPIAYEIVRSRHAALESFEAEAISGLLTEMAAEARAVVEPAASGRELVERRFAFMRYVGQGHEISVEVPTRDYTAEDAATFTELFEQAYKAQYGRAIEGMTAEVMTWAVTVSTAGEKVEPAGEVSGQSEAKPASHRDVFDAGTAAVTSFAIFNRKDLAPGALIHGPALIVEDETTTVVSPAFDAEINALGYIDMTRKPAEAAA